MTDRAVTAERRLAELTGRLDALMKEAAARRRGRGARGSGARSGLLGANDNLLFCNDVLRPSARRIDSKINGLAGATKSTA
jgi:hypothetical protein